MYKNIFGIGWYAIKPNQTKPNLIFSCNINILPANLLIQFKVILNIISYLFVSEKEPYQSIPPQSESIWEYWKWKSDFSLSRVSEVEPHYQV